MREYDQIVNEIIIRQAKGTITEDWHKKQVKRLNEIEGVKRRGAGAENSICLFDCETGKVHDFPNRKEAEVFLGYKSEGAISTAITRGKKLLKNRYYIRQA